MKLILAFLSALYFLTAAAFAGPLPKTWVPATADWVTHLDVPAFAGSRISALLQSKDAPPAIRTYLQKTRQTLGIDLMRDIKHITLYGSAGDDRQGTAIIVGSFKPAPIINHLQRNKSHLVLSVGTLSIHQWIEPSQKQTLYLCFESPTRVIVATSSERITGAIATIQGKQPNLTAGARFPLPKTGAGDFIVGGGVQAAAPISLLSKGQYFRFRAGESNEGLLNLTAHLDFPAAEDAADGEKILMGTLMAFVLTNSKDPQLATLIRNLRIEAEGKTLTARFVCPSDEAYELLCASLTKSK